MSVRRAYETTFIVNAALEDQDVEAVINKVNNYIENHGGNVFEVQRWGRRRLAYPINKKFNGYYVHIEFNAMSNIVPVIERFLVLEDTVLRHLTLQLPDKLRDYRSKRSFEAGKPSIMPDVVDNEPDKLSEVDNIESEKVVEPAPVEDIADLESTTESITDEL